MELLLGLTIGLILGYGLWSLSKHKKIMGVKEKEKEDLLRHTKMAMILFMGGSSLGLQQVYGWGLELVLWLFLISLLLLVTFIDLGHQIIPNRLVLAGAGVGVFFVLFNPQLSPGDAALGCVVAGGSLALISFATKGAMGMGDVKLFACLGIFLGLWKVLQVLLWAAILSGIAGLFLLSLKRATRKTTMPFAPFILMGTILVLLMN